jgi:hypothetical protein
MSKYRRIVIFCEDPLGNPYGDGRHRWMVVPGLFSTPDHPYTERRCRRCSVYEVDIR